MISEIEDYFLKGCGRCKRFATRDCSARLWADGLQDLRRICREAGLVEAVKWGHPCYCHAGRNIAIIGAFRGDFRLSFFNAALMKDPASVLENQGENTSHPDMIRFTDAAQVSAQEAIIRSYLREAMGYAEAGLKPASDAREVDLPDELIKALDADPELADAFHALTPGRKKSYALNLNSSKTAAARISRIVSFRAKILAGKGATER